MRGVQSSRPVIAHNEGDHLDLLWRETQQVLAVADDVAGMLVVGRMTHKKPHTVPTPNTSHSKGLRKLFIKQMSHWSSAQRQ